MPRHFCRALRAAALAALLLAGAASAAMKVAKGDKVEVQAKGGAWRSATVVKVAGGRPLVHYDDGGADEWVSPLQLRAPGSGGSAAAQGPATPPAAPPPGATPPPPNPAPSGGAAEAPATPPPSTPAPEGSAAPPALVAEATPAPAAAPPEAGPANPPLAPNLAETAASLGAAGQALSTARFESAEFNSVSFDGASLTGTFNFENPTGSPLSFDKLDWAFLCGPNRLVGGSTGSKQSIAAGARQRIAVPVTLNFNAVPGLVAALVKGKTKFAVEAVATLRGPDGAPFVVPMRWDGELALPKLPKVSAKKVEVTDLGLTEIVITLTLDVNNPNPFPIPLDALTGAVSISRIQVARLALPEPKSLAGGATTAVDLPIAIEVADVAGDVIKQIRSGKATFEFSSELKVAGKSLPFSYRSSATRR